jgi:periplasmic protein TonB
MSQTLVDHRSRRPDIGRTLAISVTLTLNGALLLLAIRPLARQPIPRPRPQAVPVLLLPAQPVPPPPMPKLLPLPPRAKPDPTPVVHRPPAPAPPITLETTPVSIPQPTIAPPPATPADHAPASPSTPPGPIRASLAYLRAPPPRYPTAARRARMQGTVILRVLVDAQGKPQQVRIQQSSGYPLLDRAARLQVLRTWLFQPAQHNGRATRAWGLVPVNFHLNAN